MEPRKFPSLRLFASSNSERHGGVNTDYPDNKLNIFRLGEAMPGCDAGIAAFAGEDITMSSRTKTNIQEPQRVAVTVPEAARMLGYRDYRPVYRLIRGGDLHARKVGRMFLVSVKSIHDFVGA